MKVRSASNSSSMKCLRRAKVINSCFFNGTDKTFLPLPWECFLWSCGNCFTITSVSTHRTTKALLYPHFLATLKGKQLAAELLGALSRKLEPSKSYCLYCQLSLAYTQQGIIDYAHFPQFTHYNSISSFGLLQISRMDTQLMWSHY